MAQRAPETLTLVSHRTQPTAETIVRLTVTAVFAYLISLTVPGTSHSVLAPLTALLVAQVSLYQTLRSAISRGAGSGGPARRPAGIRPEGQAGRVAAAG